MNGTTRYHCELAWLGGERAQTDVLIEVVDGRIGSVRPGVPRPSDAQSLAGLTLPGFANAHSHVFHRAIRGHSQSGVADFWAWRELMYAVAARLDADSLYRLALATYAEMALAGITAVGEFFYVHHGEHGPYDDPNLLGRTVIRAANDAGIRITLLDTCYLQAGPDGRPLEGVQRRFDDGSWQAWSRRVSELENTPLARIGTAIHSVRAVPRAALRPLAEHAAHRGQPLHVHVSEQPAENEACLRAYGLTPTGLLAAEGVTGPGTTFVHATHLGDRDIELIGASRTTVCMCCTTERDLADGVGPALRLARAGAPLAVGSDAHMAIDLLEETRAIELDERLVSGTRGHLRASELLTALTSAGSASIGWDAGELAPGRPADLTVVALDSPRTAGARAGDALAHVVFAATAADVTDVVVAGRPVVRNGRHLAVPDTGRALESAIAAVLPDAAAGLAR